MRRLLALFSGAILCGCTTPSSSQSGTTDQTFIITPDKSPFYKFGPAQAAGPDSTLVKNDRVRMVRREFGFSRVETEDGQFGYVATEDMKLAPPPEPTPPPLQPQLAKRSRSRLPTGVSQPNDIPLPQDSPAPGFRY